MFVFIQLVCLYLYNNRMLLNTVIINNIIYPQREGNRCI